MIPLQLQGHLWVMHLLRQDCLGWLHQAWQITHPRAVQIDLLHSDTALKPPGTNIQGGMEILVCLPILDWPASGMHRLAGVSAYISCFFSILFSGGVQCRAHFTGNTIYLPSMTHFSVQRNSLDVTPKVDSWAGKGVDQRTFGPIATPQSEFSSPKTVPIRA